MNRENWEIWESDVADDLDASRVKASGRFFMFKADVKSDTMLIDCKYTSKSKYIISGPLWQELSMWSRNEMREPALVIRFDEVAYEAAVVKEQWYCENFDKDTSSCDTPNSVSKTINARCLIDKDELVFQIGGYRLVALDYQRFKRKVLEIESR